MHYLFCKNLRDLWPYQLLSGLIASKLELLYIEYKQTSAAELYFCNLPQKHIQHISLKDWDLEKSWIGVPYMHRNNSFK